MAKMCSLMAYSYREVRHCETEWLARTLKNMMWECQCADDIWKLESEHQGKQNARNFNIPSSRVVLALTETEDLHVQEGDMFELSAHSNLRILAITVTSMIVCHFYNIFTRTLTERFSSSKLILS
jgi:hypothetical protein